MAAWAVVVIAADLCGSVPCSGAPVLSTSGGKDPAFVSVLLK